MHIPAYVLLAGLTINIMQSESYIKYIFNMLFYN